MRGRELESQVIFKFNIQVQSNIVYSMTYYQVEEAYAIEYLELKLITR